MDASRTNKMLLFGLMGFAMGMLFAPEKGEVTRQKIKQRAQAAADKAKGQKDAAIHKLHEIRGKKDEIVSKMDRAMEDAQADILP